MAQTLNLKLGFAFGTQSSALLRKLIVKAPQVLISIYLKAFKNSQLAFFTHFSLLSSFAGFALDFYLLLKMSELRDYSYFHSF